VKILLWHGYLLTGSGSNVYSANIARSWRRRGHDVLILCQERHPETLGFVDDQGTFANDNSRIDWAGASGREHSGGRCRVARPDIGEILPVYVYDAYEGIEAKTFVDLSETELASYTERNVAALSSAIGDFDPDVIITGHEVMGPYIARRACEPISRPYLAKLHGSALEYAVKKQERYRHYAIEGLSGAARVVGGSRYMVGEAAANLAGWEDRAAVVNPGCDVELFTPRARSSDDKVVGFVGKLIASKGVHNLLAALPLSREVGQTVIVGYGGFEAELRDMAAALRAGDLAALRALAQRGEDGAPLPELARFLDNLPDAYVERARRLQIEFTGRLEHGPLSRLLPTFDVLVVPSVVPEAFGMVAAEAAAAGVLALVPSHSGIAEAGAAVEEAIGRPGWLTFDHHDPILGIGAAIDRVLSVDVRQRQEMGDRASALARHRWSWERVADRLLELAQEG
jgi:glycosyltransferase involved in cell wall biosynthesis